MFVDPQRAIPHLVSPMTHNGLVLDSKPAYLNTLTPVKLPQSSVFDGRLTATRLKEVNFDTQSNRQTST